MCAFRLVKSETRPLTMQLAEEFRDLEPSPTERELNPKRVTHLRDKAEHKQLVTFQWSVAKLGERRLRMNGQHSSNMLCGLNGSFPDDLKVHLDEYEVETERDLALLFRQFDDRRSSRTTGDVAGAYQMLREPLRDVPKAAAKLAIEAIVWYRRNVEGIPVPSGDDVYELFNESGLFDYIRWIGEVLSIKTPELKRAPIVAAMYASFIASETGARTFWHEVGRGGVDYEEQAPASVLDCWLKQLKEEGDGLKPGEYYQGSVYAWNAFRENKTLKDIKYDVRKGFHKVIE